MEKLRTVLLIGGITAVMDADKQVRMAKIVRRHSVDIIGIVVDTSIEDHGAEAERIASLLVPTPPIFYSSRPDKDREIIDFLQEKKAQFGINIGFNQIIRKKFLDQFSTGVMGIHPAILPYNRGCHHSFWGIMDGTSHGTSLFWLEPGIDTGDIIDQVIFEDDGVMSAEEIQRRSNELYEELLERNLQAIIDGTAPRIQQEGGNYHSIREIGAATTFDAEDSISFSQLLRLSRATNCRGNGFYVKKDGKTYLVRASVSLAEPSEDE